MYMRINKSRHGNLSAPIDFPPAMVAFIRADDPVAADRDIPVHQFAGHKIQKPRILDHQIRRLAPQRLVDAPRQKLGTHRFLPHAGWVASQCRAISSRVATHTFSNPEI